VRAADWESVCVCVCLFGDVKWSQVSIWCPIQPNAVAPFLRSSTGQAERGLTDKIGSINCNYNNNCPIWFAGFVTEPEPDQKESESPLLDHCSVHNWIAKVEHTHTHTLLSSFYIVLWLVCIWWLFLLLLLQGVLRRECTFESTRELLCVVFFRRKDRTHIQVIAGEQESGLEWTSAK